jgi:ribosomal protein S6
MVGMQEKTDIEGAHGRVYEVGYLLVPNIPEEEVATIYGNFKELVSSLGGEFIMDEMPKMFDLAYTMQKVVSNVRHKFSTAYFGWVKFEMDPSGMATLKKKLEDDTKILRYMIMKTVRENTVAGKRLATRDFTRRRKETKEGEPVEINKEEIDKEIEAMVAE